MHAASVLTNLPTTKARCSLAALLLELATRTRRPSLHRILSSPPVLLREGPALCDDRWMGWCRGHMAFAAIATSTSLRRAATCFLEPSGGGRSDVSMLAPPPTRPLNKLQFTKGTVYIPPRSRAWYFRSSAYSAGIAAAISVPTTRDAACGPADILAQPVGVVKVARVPASSETLARAAWA